MYKRVFLAAVLSAAVCCISVVGQTAVKARFVSHEGGFAIDLPRTIDESARPAGLPAEGAASYTWRTDAGNFTVGYVDGIKDREDGPPVLRQLADTVIKTQLNMGGTVTGITNLGYYGNAGFEVRSERPGVRAVSRFFLVKDRLYIITADWPKTRDENEPMRIIESFMLIDNSELVA